MSDISLGEKDGSSICSHDCELQLQKRKDLKINKSYSSKTPILYFIVIVNIKCVTVYFRSVS